MKKILAITTLAIALASCIKDSYTEVNMTTYSGFDFTNIIGQIGADSLYVESIFNGGTYGPYTMFLSAREAADRPATGGFVLSMKVDSTLTMTEDNREYARYTTYAKNNLKGNAFAVFYQNPEENKMPEHDILFTHATVGTCTPSSLLLSNTKETIYNILQDEAFKFGPGDYLKLTVTGYGPDGAKTGEAEYFLADYRKAPDSSRPDSILTNWKPMKLDKLGKIEYVDFNIEASKSDFPLTVCVDDFVSSIYLKM